MNGTAKSELFGFVPLSKLQVLNAASPKKNYRFLRDLGDIESHRNDLDFEAQLNQRIALLAHAAILKRSDKCLSFVLKKIVRKYKSLSLVLDDVYEAQRILKNYNSNWLSDLQKIIALWTKSCSFAEELKSKFEDDGFRVIEESDLLVTHSILLRASQAYKVCEIANEVLSKWQSILNYEYGLLELNKVSHLGSLNNDNKSYTILLDCRILFQHLESDLDIDSILLHHISRRVIGLAGAALITLEEGYFSQADALIKITEAKLTNKELQLAKKLLLSAKEIGFHKDWKEKWINLKYVLEEKRQASELFTKDIDLTLLRNNDLASAIQKYLFVRANEEVLSRVDVKMRERRTVSFQKTSPRDALLEEAGMTLEVRKLNPKELDSESSEESLSPRNEKLEEWLKTNHPNVFDLFESKGIRVSLTKFLQRQHPQILQSFYEGKTTPPYQLEEFHRYKKMAVDPLVSFTCLNYFFLNNTSIVLEFFTRSAFINFSSFVFHNYNSEFIKFLNEYDKGNLIVQSEPIESISIIELSFRNQRRKKHLFFLHNDVDFQIFFRKSLSHFIDDQAIEEILCSISLSLQKKCDNSLELFDIIYSIYTLTIFKKMHRKPEIVHACYDYFMRYNSHAVQRFIEDTHFFSFMRFCLENYSNELKAFFLSLYLPILERILKTALTKKTAPPYAVINSENMYASPAKRYIHQLMTCEEFRKKVEQALNLKDQELEITESEAKKLTKASRLRINGICYKILSIAKITINKTCWKIKIKYQCKYKDNGYQYNLIEIPKVEDCLKKSDDDKLTVSEQWADLMAAKMDEAEEVFLKIGTNIFKLHSLKHDILPFTVYLLKARVVDNKDEDTVNYELNTHCPTVLDLFAGLQDNIFKNRRLAAEFLEKIQ